MLGTHKIKMIIYLSLIPNKIKRRTSMKKITGIWLGLVGLLFILACEEEFDPPVVVGEENFVIEGYVEAYHNDPAKFGLYAKPTYVIITKSISFYSTLGQEEYESLFVKNATVTVSNGTDTLSLQPICLAELEPSSRDILVNSLGLNSADLSLLGFDFTDTDFCAYIDLTFQRNEIGKTYYLTIEIGDTIITAQTTIPKHFPIDADAISFELPTGDSAFFEKTDLRQMQIKVSDPDSVTNFYRYFTQQNKNSMYRGNASFSGFRSVMDDRVFSEEGTFVRLPKGEPRDSSFNTGGNLFGNWRKGDDYIVKWCNLDEAHFNFWNATEFNELNQGFFSTYTQPPFNVKGAIGVWGGYSVSFYKGQVPRK